MSCYRHTYVSARFQCPGCKAVWCPECVERPEYEHVATTVCPSCKGLLRAIPPTPVPSADPYSTGYEAAASYPVEGSFFGDLWRAYLFPFRPYVFVTMMLITTVFFFSPMCVRSLHLLALWMILVTASMGLVSNYLGDIIMSVAVGDEELPRLQMFENFIIDGIFAGSRAIFLCVLCFGALPYLALQGFATQGLLITLCTSFFFPVLWLGSAFTRSLSGALHPELFKMLRTISIPYLLTYLCMIIGLAGCYMLFGALHKQEDGFAYISVFPMVSYFLFVMSFMLGKLVYHHQEEFEDAGLL